MARSFNYLMHPRNRYRHEPPDFYKLALKYPEFRKHCTIEPCGKVFVDFHSDDTVRALTRSLLLEHFQLDVQLPHGSLVPRVPQKLNYILWLEDLLRLNHLHNDVVGVDIGTGASCIYPLLGTRVCGWKFVGTDCDQQSVQAAALNISRNGLANSISVFKVSEEDMIKDVIRSYPDVEFTFCMCNPPFYEIEEVEQKFNVAPSGSLINECSGEGRAPPNSSTTARNNELAVQGGEVSFINRIISDSLILRDNIKIYTSMVGKKTSMFELKRRLARLDGVHYVVHTLNQGKTQRWVLAWTFLPHIILQVDIACDPSACVLELPTQLPNPREWLNEQFETLQFVVKQRRDGALECDAVEPTWVRKKRSLGLKRPLELEQIEVFDPEYPPYKRPRLTYRHVAVQVSLGEGDGKDSLTNAGNFVDTEREPISYYRSNCGSQAYFPVTRRQPLYKAYVVRFLVQQKCDSHSYAFLLVDGEKQALHQIMVFLRNKAKQATAPPKRK